MARNKAEEAGHNYIEEYYQAIIQGDVTVGRWIRDWYKKIINGLQEKEYIFSQKRANVAIRFIESFCRHHEGSLAPNLIKLELWQKAMISVIFGVVDETGCRYFREVFIEIGRKNGKTLLAAAITACIVFMDPDYGKRAYFCAPKLDQARLCYDAFFQMVQKEPEMAAEAKKRRTDIYVESTNTSAAPLAFNHKKSDGLNISIGICDEIAAWSGDAGLKQYEVLKSALGARRQPLLISISTAGYVSDGIFDELIKRSTQVIKGTSKEKRLAPFLYQIDDEEKWNDINELRKANPNLGVSVSVDYMLEEIAVAEGSLSKRIEFKTKYCNMKQASSQAFLDTATIKKSFNIGPKNEEEYKDRPWTMKMIREGKITEEGNNLTLEDFERCYGVLGVDLSQSVDLTAINLLIYREGVHYYFPHFFLPSAKLETATARDQLPYAIYEEKGFLQLSGENFINYDDCLAYCKMLREKYKIYVLMVGLDRYCAQFLQADLEAALFKTDTVFQGPNLTGVINVTEGMMEDGTLQCATQNDLMKVHWMDAAVKKVNDRNQRVLEKIQANAHVDGVASLLDAVCIQRNIWPQYKGRLENPSRAA